MLWNDHEVLYYNILRQHHFYLNLSASIGSTHVKTNGVSQAYTGEGCEYRALNTELVVIGYKVTLHQHKIFI